MPFRYLPSHHLRVDEIRNVLIVAERRGRIDADATEHHVNRLRILPLVTDDDQDDARTLAFARRHALSSYDAAYLETAKRRGTTIATLDAKTGDRGRCGRHHEPDGLTEAAAMSWSVAGDP